MIITDKAFKPYYIRVEEYQYILAKTIKAIKRNTKEEYESEKIIGYFDNLDHLFKHLIHKKLAKSRKTVELQEFLNLYQKERRKITRVLTKAGLYN